MNVVMYKCWNCEIQRFGKRMFHEILFEWLRFLSDHARKETLAKLGRIWFYLLKNFCSKIFFFAQTCQQVSVLIGKCSRMFQEIRRI